jgi:hypothetical protein
MSYLFPPRDLEIENSDLPSVHSILQVGKAEKTGHRCDAVELSNEIFCTWLANYIGLPIDSWQLWTTPGNMTSPPASGLWFDGYKNYTTPISRICYASWLAPDSIKNLCYEIIPSKWQHRVTNHDDFVGIVMFDVWTGAQKPRKAVYVNQDDHKLRALFISHGKTFNMSGVDGAIQYDSSVVNRNIQKLMSIHRHALAHWSEEAIARWASKLRELDENIFQMAFDYSCCCWQPREWAAEVRAFIEDHRNNIDSIAENIYRHLKQIT